MFYVTLLILCDIEIPGVVMKCGFLRKPQILWHLQPKQVHQYTPLAMSELAVFLVVAHFHNGAGSIILVLQELGISPGAHCKNACHKLDHTYTSAAFKTDLYHVQILDAIFSLSAH